MSSKKSLILQLIRQYRSYERFRLLLFAISLRQVVCPSACLSPRDVDVSWYRVAILRK